MAGLLSGALVLTLATTNAMAAPRHSWAIERICSGGQTAARRCRLNFVDADGNGVCDNCNSELCLGNCQGQGQNQGQGWGHHGGKHHH